MGQTDLVVVGAGPAGIACAVFAAGRGRRVVLLEKADRVGGTLYWSGGHVSAAGTRRQAARGIVDSVDAHYADILRISRGTMRPDITRLCVEQAVPAVEWLEDIGFEYDDSTPRLVFGHEPYSTPRTVHGTKQGLSLLEVLEPQLAEAVASGRVDLRLGARVAELIAAGGRVGGVRTSTGEEIGAAAVVLATGGFGHNPELFAELDGAPLVTSAAPTATGDGLLMARELGAGVAGKGMYIPTFGGLPPEPGELRVDWVNRPQLVAPERPPWEIYVDRGGRRWIDEDEPSIDRKERVLTMVQDMTFWQVFDARALRESHPFVHGWSARELHQQCGVRRGVECADTLDELARRSGIDADGLMASVSRYNAQVAAGDDFDFGRAFLPAPIAEPPFYAIENHPVTLITFAGVDVDIDLRVRREDGSTIAGLYAVGELIGSAAYNGNSFCSGMSLTPALALGRLLGLRL